MSIQPINGVPDTPRAKEIKRKKEKLEARAVSKTDSLNISSEGKKLQQVQKDIEIARKSIENSPDVRADKVRVARERVAEGYYLGEKVVEQIAERIIAGIGVF